jgi:WD40 repeat protein
VTFSKIWDLQNGSLARSMDGFDGVFGASWNYSGGLLACIGGKEGVRVVDSRKQAVVNTFPAHDLAEKTSSVVWDKDQRLVTCGFGKGSQRQVRVFDLRKPDPLQTFNLDISNGAMTMHLDVDTGVLFLAGKGDGSVQMLELTADDKCVHELTSWRSSTPQTAVCFLPKQCW